MGVNVGARVGVLGAPFSSCNLAPWRSVSFSRQQSKSTSDISTCTTHPPLYFLPLEPWLTQKRPRSWLRSVSGLVRCQTSASTANENRPRHAQSSSRSQRERRAARRKRLLARQTRRPRRRAQRSPRQRRNPKSRQTRPKKQRTMTPSPTSHPSHPWRNSQRLDQHHSELVQ